MRIARYQDLQVWRRSMELTRAVFAMSAAQGLQRDRSLREQIDQAAVSVASNIAEGFGQQSDRAFKAHLHVARGSNNELATQLRVALERGYVSGQQFDEADALCEEVGRMLTGLISYLRRADRKDRG